VKPLSIVVLAFALSIVASVAHGSDMIVEVVKLQRAGIDNEVILSFVQSSDSSADLSADDIQRLEDFGVSSSVIIAMLDRSQELREHPDRVAVPVAQTVRYDESEQIVAPAEGEANISLFYEALAPYGTWSQDNTNGWVWEPTDGVRDRSWRPYANDGHWTWTDHGWYWESNSPYGWATFHYGRWGYNSNNRWSWSPDNVWGPAWVDWRYSNDHIGWAPLPHGSRFEAGTGFHYRGKNVGFDFHSGIEERDYAFVSSDAFLNVDLRISFVREERRHHVYEQTKIVNNTYIYNDNRIINNGVPAATVIRATKRQLEEVKVVDASIPAGQPIKGDRRSENKIAAYRPNIANKVAVEPPAIIERRKAAVAQRAANKQDRAQETAARHETRETAKSDRKDNAEAEKQSRQRLAAEKDKRKKAQPAAQNRQSEVKPVAPAEPAKSTVAEERRAANQEAAQERKTEAAAVKDAQAKAREEKQAEKREAQQAPIAEPKAVTPLAAPAESKADERRSANQEAATERKAEAAATKDANDKARDAKQAENLEAAKQRKAEADAKKEAKRDEREEKKDEKEQAKKDRQEK
jgi:hypothetical protein